MLRSTIQALRATLLLLATLLGAASCVTEDVGPSTPSGVFSETWRALDEHYCFFALKGETYGVDWAEVRSRYAPQVSDNLSDRALLELLAAMTAELRDGHVNIYASHDVARYTEWFDAYPTNYADTLERVYLGRGNDYALSSGLKYRILSDNIGYLRCESFSNVPGSGNLNEIMRSLATCDGLIVDIRSNGGGQLTAAQKLASLFVDADTTAFFIAHKTAAAHDAFSAPERETLHPFEGLRWQKPVCILTNRSTYSAANAFVMMLKGLPAVTIVGDVTGGGAGLPFSTELPNGWTLRFSACPMYDREMRLTELGIAPDVKVDIADADYARSVDTIIETARALLRAKAGVEASK